MQNATQCTVPTWKLLSLHSSKKNTHAGWKPQVENAKENGSAKGESWRKKRWRVEMGRWGRWGRWVVLCVCSDKGRTVASAPCERGLLPLYFFQQPHNEIRHDTMPNAFETRKREKEKMEEGEGKKYVEGREKLEKVTARKTEQEAICTSMRGISPSSSSFLLFSPAIPSLLGDRRIPLYFEASRRIE